MTTEGRALRGLLREEPLVILPPADAQVTLRRLRSCRIVAACAMLDPWYNRGVGGTRRDYLPWLRRLVRLAGQVARHVFVWGFPEILALLVPGLPTSLKLRAWLTWHYANAPSRSRGWRPAQQACLHLSRPSARLHVENFLSPEQKAKRAEGKLQFMPAPPSVISAPLIVGWSGRSEATGHPAQKPERVLEPLVLMSTVPGDLIIDPMAGSGTSGAVVRKLGRRALLVDSSEGFTGLMEARLGLSRVDGVKSSVRARAGRLTPSEMEARRRAAVALVGSGRSKSDVARELGVSREAVRQWVALVSLQARPKRGAAPKLDEVQVQRLIRVHDEGHLTGTAAEQAAKIEALLGVRFHAGSIGRLLSRVLGTRARG